VGTSGMPSPIAVKDRGSGHMDLRDALSVAFVWPTIPPAGRRKRYSVTRGRTSVQRHLDFTHCDPVGFSWGFLLARRASSLVVTWRR
jgi:hypothetical protein